MRKRTVALIFGTVAVIVLTGVIAWWALAFRERGPEQSSKSGYLAWIAYQEVKRELQISDRMTISDAERLLSDAWHHITCPMRGDFTEHLFFFGSHDIGKTGIVLVEVRRTEQGEAVTDVYIVESYMAMQYGCVKADPLLTPNRQG